MARLQHNRLRHNRTACPRRLWPRRLWPRRLWPRRLGPNLSGPRCPGPRHAIGRLAGLSLMEAIVVVGVMTIIMFIVTQIFIINYDLFLKQSKRTDNEAGAVIAARTISQMARGAVAVVQNHGFDGNSVVSSDTALVLKLPSIDSSGNVLPNTYDYVGFYRDATETNKMFAAIDADDTSARVDSDRLITNYNQMLNFRYNNPTITDASRVSIYILNRQTQKQTEITTRGWTSIFLRNY